MSTTGSMPEDFTNGVAGLIDEAKEGYDDVVPLGERFASEVKLKQADGGDEAAMALKYGYSAPINQLSRMSIKPYSYVRDGHLEDPLEKAALMGSNIMNDIIWVAPCVNRKGRFDEEEERIRQWEKIRDNSPPREGEPSLEDLLTKWSKADAFMLQARVIEEHDGVAGALHLYAEYVLQKVQRDEVELEAAKLRPAANMIFWARIRQFRIMRERAYDLAMGYPTHDYTELKKLLSEGGDVHDLAHMMPWPWLAGYQLVQTSLAGGSEHREHLTSLMAGQHPPAPMPYMPGGYWPGQQPVNGDGLEGEEGQPPDKRKSLFSFGKRQQDQQQQQNQKKPLRRHASSKSKGW